MDKIKYVYSIPLLACVVLLTACETTNSIPYKASPANTISFQKKLAGKSKKVSVGQITVAAGIDEKPNCRLMGPIVVAPGKTIRQYIKEALQEELLLANSYDPASTIVIEADIDELSVSSVAPAAWNVGLRVRSNKSQGYRVAGNYKFDTSFTAVSACKNTADAFGPAVQELIKKIVEDQGFDDLTN
jgi:hypothetical protein